MSTQPLKLSLLQLVNYEIPGPAAGGPVRSTINAFGHTNGPWHVEPLDGNPRALAICAEGEAATIVAEIHRENDGLEPLDYADAAVLAAAPELLRTLREALGLLQDTLNKWEDEEDSVKEEHAEHIEELSAFLDRFHT